MANERTTASWTVIAYVGPQLNAREERLVHLYPSDIPGGAKYRCATVYEEKFDLLPYGMGDELMKADIIAGSAPEMAAAKTMGILKSCPPFMIETWVIADKKTKDIARILGPASEQAPAGRVPASKAHASMIEGLEFNAIEEDAVREQAFAIGLETLWKMRQALDVYSIVVDENEFDHSMDSCVFNAIWRDINDQYRVVRPALLTAKEGVGTQATPDGDAIVVGDRAKFLDDVAAQHSEIDGLEDAKDLCKLLDIKSSSEEPAIRVLQARQVWLCATLISEPYSLDKESAVAFALSAIQTDEVPF